ncbi:ABC transporter permease, partial [Actinomadura sp. NPDC023710]
MNALTMPLADGWTIARRNTLKIRRSPDLLGSAIMFPIVFVLMFAYVFGSVIDVPGMSYKEFLLPGIFVQAVIMGAQITGYTLTLDLQKGIFDRFRSLPMAPSGVLIGQTVSDLLMNLASLVVMAAMGL